MQNEKKLIKILILEKNTLFEILK